MLDQLKMAAKASLEAWICCTFFMNNTQKIQACGEACAAIVGDQAVVTWGDAEFGGERSAVQDKLKDMQRIQASGCGFAVIIGNGSVATWGDAPCGGDSSVVQEQRKKVRKIRDNYLAFAAILDDGCTATWGILATSVTVVRPKDIKWYLLQAIWLRKILLVAACK